MGYFIVDDIEDLVCKLEERLNNISMSKPYKNNTVILLRCKDIEDRNYLISELMYSGRNLGGISNKNGLWIKLTETHVYIESFKSLFVKCSKPNYDEIYIHKMTSPSKKFIKKLKENNVEYECIKTYCFYNEHKEYVLNNKKSNNNNNNNDGEKSKKEIPRALQGLEVSDDLHSFKYKINKDNQDVQINFYTSETIDKEKLEELVMKYF